MYVGTHLGLKTCLTFEVFIPLPASTFLIGSGAGLVVCEDS